MFFSAPKSHRAVMAARRVETALPKAAIAAENRS
jgi:hypothetical protein